MKKNKQEKDRTVTCGSANDDFTRLQALCRTEADTLATALAREAADEWEIPFWTNDVPELICVGTFRRQADGTVGYTLDFGVTTL